MWPARASSTGFSLLECIWNSFPMRSLRSFVELITCVPAAIRPIYAANPMAHLIEAFRASVLGTHPPDLLTLGVLLVLGLLVLVAAQRVFSVFDGVLADVV